MASSSSYGGFSIREYTAQMRATDITKCWPPFGGSGRGCSDTTADDEQEGERFLPPIAVVKFRWWSDAVAAAMKEIDVDVISPGSVVTRRRSEKRRRKRKKKRSIVEIFAVSPRVVARGNTQARETRKRKKNKKMKTRARTRVSEAKEVLERSNTQERSPTTRIENEVTLGTRSRLSLDDPTNFSDQFGSVV